LPAGRAQEQRLGADQVAGGTTPCRALLRAWCTAAADRVLMSNTSTLIIALGVQPLLFALGWWLVAGHLGDDRRALRHWAAFSFVGGLSMLLFHAQIAAAFGPVAVVARNVGLLLAFALLRRGLLEFTRQDRRDREQVVVVVSCSVMLVLLGSEERWLAWRTVVLSAVMAWLLLSAWRALVRGGAAEFGRPVVAFVGLPPLLFGVAMAARVVKVAVLPHASSVTITDDAAFNIALLLVALVVMAVFHFALGYLVMVRMVAELRHLSRHDALTGLLNRRAFEEQLTREIVVSRRGARAPGLLMIDVDHFKRINDSLGHAAGDAALREVARRLAEGARGGDTVGRLGGEEFAVLLPATDEPGVRAAAERLRRLIADVPLAVVEGGYAATVSVGAAVCDPAHDDAGCLLQRADTGLYRAKAEGRDRVVFAAAAAPLPSSAGTALRAARPLAPACMAPQAGP
jgi:diguanylate cyclase (GGDEF)-like protein